MEVVLGDKGRAHSLVVKGRDQGIFTKGKRGGSAPDLTHTDFASLIACALTTAAPSKIGRGVKEILGLELSYIEYLLDDADPFDLKSWRSCRETDSLPAEINEVLEVIPLGLDVPDSSGLTFGLSLSNLFPGPARLNRFAINDVIELVEQDEFKLATILLHDANATSSNGDLRGQRSLRLVFSNGKYLGLEKVESTRRLYITALNELLAIAKPIRDGGVHA